MIERLHPVTVFLYFVCTIGFSMSTRNPIFLSTSLVMGTVFLLLWKRLEEKRINYKNILFLIIFFCFVAVLNPLFQHNGETVLFYINKNQITLEALVFGLTAAEMLLAVFVWCMSLAHFMTTDKVLFLFSGISKRGALVLSMILRFLPEYRKEYKKRQECAALLGVYGSNTLAERLKGNLQVFSATADHAMEHSMDTADSMTARGYNSGRRSRYKTLFFRKADLVLCLLLVAEVLALVILSLPDTLKMQFYPVIQFPPLQLKAILSFIIYAFLCASLPLYGVIRKR